MSFWARVVCLDVNGRLLLVCRKGDPKDWILPGGRMDIGEATLRETAYRECAEETGVYGTDLIELLHLRHHRSQRPGVIFWAKKWERREPIGEELAAWGTWRDLEQGDLGPHARDIATSLLGRLAREQRGY